MSAATDYGILLAFIAVVIVACYLLRDIKRVDLSAARKPAPVTRRPEPVEFVDLRDAWRPVGPLPRWEETRLP